MARNRFLRLALELADGLEVALQDIESLSAWFGMRNVARVM